MFHHLGTLMGAPVITSDGEKRHVRNFLFDDRSWLIRYLVVDAGTWLAPRQVVLPTSKLDLPDWRRKLITARITMAELLSSPDAESVKPVSRQQQLAWNRHFGWPEDNPYWSGPGSTLAPGREFRLQEQDDPHLRRTLDLTSYQVWGDDGCLGVLEGFFVEEGSWHIGYLLVRSRDWVYRDRMISTVHVAGISWGQHRVLLDGVNAAAAQTSHA